MESFVLRSLNERIGAGNDAASAPGSSSTVTLHAGLRSTYERLGSPVGASLSADINQVNSTVNDIGVDIGNASAGTLGSLYGILGNPAETFLVKVGTTAEAEAEAGSLLARLKFALAGIRKGTGTTLAANKSLADAIGHDGNAILNSGLVAGIFGNPSSGTLTTLTARIGDNASSRGLHALIGDHATSLHAKIGATGDATTTDSVLGLIGQPADAAANPGTEGSIFAHLRSVYNAVNNVGLAPRKQTFTSNIAQITAAGGLSGNPSVGWTNAATKTDGDYTADTCIAYSMVISAPDSGTKTVDGCDVAVHWKMKLNGTPGTVESKWAVVSGNTATVTGAADLTDEFTTASATYVEQSRSGQVKLTAMNTLPFTLMLLSKVSAGATSVDTAVGTDSYIDVTYSV